MWRGGRIRGEGEVNTGRGRRMNGERMHRKEVEGERGETKGSKE